MQAIIFKLLKSFPSNFTIQPTVAAFSMPNVHGRKIISLLCLPPLPRHHQSVYGVAEEGAQSQSPIHTPSHHCRKGTKEDVEKEVKNLSN